MENERIREKKKYFFSKNLKRQTIFMAISVCAVLLIMFGTSYAIFSSVNKSEDYNGINVGNLHITYADESGAVSLTNSFPVSDEVGLQGTPYSFSIQNTGTLATTYYVDLSPDMGVIEEEEENDPDIDQKLLEDKDIKVSVNGGTPTIIEDLPDGCELAEGTLQPGETKKFTVRLWIRSDAGNDIFYEGANGDLVGKSYYGMITVSGENTKTYETEGLAMWLDAKNKYGSLLPGGYKQVEYLESTGSQYIDLGIGQRAALNTTIEMSYYYTDTSTTNYLMGFHPKGSGFSFNYGFYSSTNGSYIVNTYNVGTNNISDTIRVETASIDNRNFSSRIYKNGALINESDNIDLKYTSRSDANIYLFAMAQVWWEPTKYAKARVASFKLWDSNNVLTRNLIPCLDNTGRPCMYDLVTKTTFYNENEDGEEFNYGSAKYSGGYLDDVTKWRDLSNNNDYNMSNFSNYTWNSNGLNINGSGLTGLGLNYDVSSLDTYSISTGFKLSSNSGDVNIINNSDINIYLSNNKLMYGDIDSGVTLDNNQLYTVTLVKKKKHTMKTDGTKESKTVLEVYVNGEFSKDVTTAEKTNVNGSNINIDIYNYLVYSKALSVNEDNNNYRLTVERFGS